MEQDLNNEDGTDAAAAWVARLHGDSVDETDWLAFESWLQSAPEHGLAYDRALALWQELDSHAPALKKRISAKPALRRWMPLAGGALAAALALGWILYSHSPTAPAIEIYQTAKGEHKSVTLADGSKIDLAGDSRLSVALAATERHVTLENGEAIFDVAHDTTRPFLIDAADRRVRVVGTEFDVRRRDDQLTVTVRRGIVEVGPADPSQGQPARLTAGERIEHRIGTAVSSVGAASADDVFAWRSGHQIYRDRPLSEVVADLNAQFARPVSLADHKTGDLRFSGVLVLDDEEGVVHRLTLLAPLWSTSTPNGITLGSKEAGAQ